MWSRTDYFCLVFPTIVTMSQCRHYLSCCWQSIFRASYRLHSRLLIRAKKIVFAGGIFLFSYDLCHSNSDQVRRSPIMTDSSSLNELMSVWVVHTFVIRVHCFCLGMEILFEKRKDSNLLNGSSNLRSLPNWICFGTALSVKSSSDYNENWAA